MAYPDDRYLVGITPGSTFYWDENGSASWSYYSGGAGGAPNPTLTNNIILDSNTCSGAYSFLERDVNATNWQAACLALIITAPASGDVTFGFSGLRAVINAYGNVSFYAGLIPASGYGEFCFQATSPSTFTSNGVNLPWGLLFRATTGSSITLLDDINCPSADSFIVFQRGTFYGNSKNITTQQFLFNNIWDRVLVPGAATWTALSAGWAVVPTSTAAVIDITPPTTPSDWVVKIQSSGGFVDAPWKAPLGTRYYGTVEFATPGATNTLTMTLGTTIDTLKTTGAAHTLQFGNVYGQGITYHIKSFQCSGTAGNINTFIPYGTTPYNFVKEGIGIVSNDYLSISYCNASPTTPQTWYAGTHSTDGGNNTGWSFTNPAAHISVNGALSLTGDVSTNHKTVSGVTKNAAGAVLGTCLVRLISDDNPILQVAKTTSDANGNYTAKTAYGSLVHVLVTKAGTPNVQGVSDLITPT